ncbi:hypothetical protein BGL87_04370 [Helicobacter pylori]|uniref:hypothetical protein n=1 Tax=Helicobacter pylori TaxID=210 RepID=UPI0009A3D560|nr:hypothetical protein [Helicobacter pylori]OPG63108.1 hypothetical protein BGL87_04370 [Helicobacter pylori]
MNYYRILVAVCSPQFLQLVNSLGNLEANQHLNNVALGMIGLSRGKLLKLGIEDRIKTFISAYVKTMYKHGEKNKPQIHLSLGSVLIKHEQLKLFG